jgi:hypothetical protein
MGVKRRVLRPALTIAVRMVTASETLGFPADPTAVRVIVEFLAAEWRMGY